MHIYMRYKNAVKDIVSWDVCYNWYKIFHAFFLCMHLLHYGILPQNCKYHKRRRTMYLWSISKKFIPRSSITSCMKKIEIKKDYKINSINSPSKSCLHKTLSPSLCPYILHSYLLNIWIVLFTRQTSYSCKCIAQEICHIH